MNDSEEIQRRLAELHGERDTITEKIHRLRQAVDRRMSRVGIEVHASESETEQLRQAIDSLRTVTDEIMALTATLSPGKAA